MPSPTFPLSSCLTGGGSRAYRFDLDIVTKSSSPSSRSSQSSPSSTLSESSNSSPLFIFTKRARAPRKRPNQCSAEAAALLSTIYPKLFSTSTFRQPSFLFQQPPDVDPFPILLPSFPIPCDDSLILREPSSPERPPNALVPMAAKANTPICSQQDFEFQDPSSPDFDAVSILDEEGDEAGIDSIMGNLSMSTNQSKDRSGDCPTLNTNSIINPYVASLTSFGLSGRLGFGFGISSNLRGAFKQSDDGEWWRSPKVSVNEIAPKFKEPTVKAVVANKKKKKKKVEKVETMAAKLSTAVSPPQDGILIPKLGLNLNYDGILKEWSGGSPFSGDVGSPESTTDVIALLGDIELFLDTGGGVVREASMLRYKEKRRSRLFSKKIRYPVLKDNAEQRPRLKGRFFRTPSHIQEAMAEGSSVS